MGGDDGQQQRAEGHHDHGDHLRRDAAEKFLKVDEGEGREDGWEHLGLVADHGNLEVAEVPEGDGILGGGGDGVGVQELAGDEGEAQDDAQHLRRAHLLRDGPADADGQHVEDGLADEPEELVHAGPERTRLHEGLRASIEEVEGVDAVAEAQDKAADDDGGDDGGEDLRDDGHSPLQRILVRLGRVLHGFLRHALDAGDGGEVVVEGSHVVADDDLELAGLGEAALHHLHGFDGGDIRLLGIPQHEAHAGHAVGDGRDVFLAAYELQELLGVLCVLAPVFPSCSLCTLWFHYAILV